MAMPIDAVPRPTAEVVALEIDQQVGMDFRVPRNLRKTETLPLASAPEVRAKIHKGEKVYVTGRLREKSRGPGGGSQGLQGAPAAQLILQFSYH
jgi:hypothetical protein